MITITFRQIEAKFDAKFSVQETRIVQMRYTINQLEKQLKLEKLKLSQQRHEFTRKVRKPPPPPRIEEVVSTDESCSQYDTFQEQSTPNFQNRHTTLKTLNKRRHDYVDAIIQLKVNSYYC